MTIKNYRGYELIAERHKTMSGDRAIIWSIMRVSDGYLGAAETSYDEDTIRTWIKTLKERVDNELKEIDPWMEEEESKEIY